MTDGVQITGMDAVTKALREATAKMEIAGKETLAKVGGEIAAAAKAISSEHPGDGIPASIHVDPVGANAVQVVAGGANVKLARLYEFGNVKRSSRGAMTFNSRRHGRAGAVAKDSATGSDQVFWHPVFGGRAPGAYQRRYPFLRPALSKSRRVITEQLDETWKRALSPLRDVQK